MQRFKPREDEDAQLKSIVADLMLEREMLQMRPGSKRAGGSFLAACFAMTARWQSG